MKSDLTLLAACVLLLKLVVFGFSSIADSLGALVILGGLLAKTVIDHKFPKLPDLFKEMVDLQNRQSALEVEKDEIQRDLTALKFGSVRK